MGHQQYFISRSPLVPPTLKGSGLLPACDISSVCVSSAKRVHWGNLIPFRSNVSEHVAADLRECIYFFVFENRRKEHVLYRVAKRQEKK
uniref:Uncharacterized protein n=1 Tax=Anguilla anguilla TaxID=7936 RepID=A0A0E9PXP3_ANGAN